MKLWDALGDLQGAEAEVTRIIEEFSPITLHYTARARLRLRRGDFDGAEKDILAASTLDNDPGRAGLAGKLRTGYAEEFPDYARYLAERGVVTITPPKPEEQPKSSPEATPHETPAAQAPAKDIAALRELFDKDFERAKEKILGPRQQIADGISEAIKSLASIEITPASSAQHVIAEADRIHAKIAEKSLKLPEILTAEERRSLLGPLMSDLAEMQATKKTVEEHVRFEQEDTPKIQAQLKELNQEMDQEPQSRINEVQKLTKALTELDKKFRDQTGKELGVLNRFVTLPVPTGK